MCLGGESLLLVGVCGVRGASPRENPPVLLPPNEFRALENPVAHRRVRSAPPVFQADLGHSHQRTSDAASSPQLRVHKLSNTSFLGLNGVRPRPRQRRRWSISDFNHVQKMPSVPKEPLSGVVDAGEESQEAGPISPTLSRYAKFWVLDCAQMAWPRFFAARFWRARSARGPQQHLFGRGAGVDACGGRILLPVHPDAAPPFVVELLLWPLQTIEYGLLYAVASTSAPAAA